MNNAIFINSCSDSSKWYKDLVGYVVPLVDEEETEYKTRQPSGYLNFVSKKDGILVVAGESVEMYTKVEFVGEW